MLQSIGSQRVRHDLRERTTTNNKRSMNIIKNNFLHHAVKYFYRKRFDIRHSKPNNPLPDRKKDKKKVAHPSPYVRTSVSYKCNY